jgi:two-component system, chemotaxis family, chemotaxis protein CheY
MRAVVVDDNAVVRELVRAILRSRHHEVVGEATGGGTVLKLCAELRPDIVLLDINLNETSGLDVLVELRAKLPNLPVVMLSGDGTPATVAKTRAMGAHGFVLKPFNPEGLFKAIDRAMAGENAPPAQS